MDATNIVTIIVGVFGGGVIGSIIRAFIDKRKVVAEATNTDINSLLEIDQRMTERMARLEERVANLEQENYKLKSEKLSLEKETHELRIEMKQLEDENKELLDENIKLKEELQLSQNDKKEDRIDG